MVEPLKLDGMPDSPSNQAIARTKAQRASKGGDLVLDDIFFSQDGDTIVPLEKVLFFCPNVPSSTK